MRDRRPRPYADRGGTTGRRRGAEPAGTPEPDGADDPPTRAGRGRAGRAESPDPAAGRRPTRRRYLLRRWMVLVVVLALLGLGYVIGFTPVLGVRTVEVTGVTNIPADQVREVAAIERGTPLVRLDTDAVGGRVATLPRVFSVRVSRSLPATVRIEVTERTPVAVRELGDGIHLVDRTGTDYAVVKKAPKGLPELWVSEASPDDPATTAAVAVLGAIPDDLLATVVAVSADSPGDVRLILKGKRTVKWGDQHDSDRKAAVLVPLLTRPGTTYDVATPDFPTVS